MHLHALVRENEMKVWRVAFLVLLAGAGATSLCAAHINPFNDRTPPVPVTIPSPDGAGKDLQSDLNKIYGCTSCVNAIATSKKPGCSS